MKMGKSGYASMFFFGVAALLMYLATRPVPPKVKVSQ
jgi:hypothetical protein